MKKRYKPKWYHWILFILAWVLLLPFALLAVPYMWYVSRPMQRAIDEQAQYWQNWKQIKLKSRRSTMQVLSMLLGNVRIGVNLIANFVQKKTLSAWRNSSLGNVRTQVNRAR